MIVVKRPSGPDELQSLPGIGPSLARDLRELGVRRVADLKRRDPERMYAQLERLRGSRQDPCVLYAFRCAAYAARTARPKPELLKWWNWKDRALRAT
jgi:pathogenicity locus Cdd1 protein